MKHPTAQKQIHPISHYRRHTTTEKNEVRGSKDMYIVYKDPRIYNSVLGSKNEKKKEK